MRVECGMIWNLSKHWNPSQNWTFGGEKRVAWRLVGWLEVCFFKNQVLCIIYKLYILYIIYSNELQDVCWSWKGAVFFFPDIFFKEGILEKWMVWKKGKSF